MTEGQGRGMVRELTQAEIGAGVANFRKQLGLKQLALASEAGVTERTIQRIEAGHKVDDDTLRRVSKALQLSENAFFGPRYIPTEEEAIKDATQFLEDHSLVELKPVLTSRDVVAIISCNAWWVDDSQVADELLPRTAAIKEWIEDLGNCKDDMGQVALLESSRDLLAEMKSTVGLSNCVSFGIYESRESLKVAVVLFAPVEHSRPEGRTVLVPRRILALL